jgi:hypothetical protein
VIQAKYIGSDPALQGETVIVRPVGDGTSILLVQFDNQNLGDLALGWHQYPASDFLTTTDVEESHDLN